MPADIIFDEERRWALEATTIATAAAAESLVTVVLVAVVVVVRMIQQDKINGERSVKAAAHPLPHC